MKNPFRAIEARMRLAASTTIPQGVGTVAVHHFQESFRLQAFNEPGSTPWKQVKRRIRTSNWFGFKLGAKQRRPGVRPRKKDGRGNYSPAATTRAILFGSGSSRLRDGIFVAKATRQAVIVANRNKHASLHNTGGRFKVFGKRTAIMPKRQFMGTGTRLQGRLQEFLRIELKRVLKG